jgi:hypothetical protein
MGDKPPKLPPDKKNDVLAALESALLEARQRVSEAVEGLRAVMRGRESGKLADDTGRHARRLPKAKTIPPELRKPKRR